jgi:acyl-CoA thioester hydrolase
MTVVRVDDGREINRPAPIRNNQHATRNKQSPTSMYEHTINIRVRYPEVDGMGYLHHSRYLQYFEMGRVELLRSLGHSYADLEKAGVFFVVVKAEVKYKAPAKYDDELTLTTRLVKQTHVRYDHTYELKRGTIVLAEGATTIACVDREGQLTQIPESLGPKT